MKQQLQRFKYLWPRNFIRWKIQRCEIKGSGQIKGDIECVNVKIYGDGQFDGKLEVEDTVNIKGKTEFKGALEAENLKIQGEVRVKAKCLQMIHQSQAISRLIMILMQKFLN